MHRIVDKPANGPQRRTVEGIFLERIYSKTGMEMNYAEGPASGPPLLLLHGFSNNWKEFLPLAPALSRRWHIFAPDFRGHGKSHRTSGRYTVEECTADIKSFLRDVVRDPAVIIGHSLGAMVGIMVAARSANSVNALVIGDAPLYQDTIIALRDELRGWSKAMMKLLGGNLPPKLIAAALPKIVPGKASTWYQYKAECCTQLDPEIFTAVERGLGGYDCELLLPRISCPVLLIQANTMTDSDVAKALGQLQDGSVVRLKNVGHGLHLEKKGFVVVRAIMRFLDSLERTL
ncbi:MAG: alpha/beta hydrolase [Ignavibacteriales bacterium]|nr:alpha/beta hydrolase [Ignavibacteriales bacterium]